MLKKSHVRFSKIPQVLITAGLSLALATSPSVALACTQIYVGSAQSADGDTYWGRSEDFANRYGKAFGIEPATTQGKTLQSYENGVDPSESFQYKIEGPTFRYTYVRDTPDNWTLEGDVAAKAYSEAGTNEKGVSVSSTLTTNMNDKIDAVDPRVDTGIGEYSIADFVLSQASTAREGVELLGKVIDEKGTQDANQIVIGDAKETWIFMQLSGHEWCAVKMTPDVVSLNPNMDNLKFDANLDDAETCLHSAGIVETAKKAGSYVERDGAMDVAGSYGSTSEAQEAGQNTRYVQGHDYFGDAKVAGTDYTTDDKGQVTSLTSSDLTFTPASKSDTFTVLRAYATRGEGTDVDANKNADLYAIGNNRTTETHVFQVRRGLDADIATVQWEALSRSEFSVFVPSYSALLTKVDESLYPSEANFDVSHIGEITEYKKDESGKKVYDPTLIDVNEATAMQDSGTTYLDYALMDLNTLAYNNRESVADGVHAYLDALQKEIVAQQQEVDAQMQATADGPARNALADEAHRVVSNETYAKVNALLGEVRSYLGKGDASTPFKASDLKDDGTLATPFAYASAVKDFDAQKAAADVKLPVTDEDVVAKAVASYQPEAEVPASTGLSAGNVSLLGFLGAFALFVVGMGRRNKRS